MAPVLAGLGAVLLLAAAGAVAYFLVLPSHRATVTAPLPTRVVSFQTVGLIAESAKSAGGSGGLLQLLASGRGLAFSPLGPAALTQGHPEWTADLMSGGTYIFIYLPSSQCLAAAGTPGSPRLDLQRCDLGLQQRWRKVHGAVENSAHDFYQYANAGDGDCLSQAGVVPGQLGAADVAPCAASQPASQLIAFWWSS